MADLRISQLNALNGVDLAAADLLVAVDDSASETKKLTVGDLISNGVTLIADDTIPGAKILFAAGGIATADLADSAVNTVKLADNSVTAAKLTDESTVDLVTTLPASGAFTGQLALDTDDNFLYVWNGSVWVSLKAAGSINTVSGDTSGTINITTSTSGSTVTVSATIDDTTVANQFLAGPTGAGGTAAYRVIDSTDLPTSSTTAKGAVLVNGEGLRMDGDTIEVDNDVTDTTTHHVVTYSAKGLITGGRTLTSADLPLATSTDPGAIIPGDGLAVDVNGNLSIDNTVATGTYTKVTVTAEGVVSTGDTLDADDIPDHSAAKLTSGTIGSSLIASGAVTATKLADESVTQFGGAIGSDNVTVFPAGDFKGQFFYDETTQDLYIYTGSAFVPITVLSGNLVNAGAYNANTNLMSSVTTAGSSAGFSVGSALPAPSGVNLNHYVVVDTSGTGSGAAPAVALAPPDMLLSQGVGTEYSLIDVSNAIAGQTASNISLIAAGNIVATDVQAGIQELDTEKLPKAGGTMTGDLTLNNVNVVFEGSSADDYETTLTVTNPTADRTITLPNVTGTVVTTGDTGSVTSTMITDGTIVNADINASAEIAVSKLANGTARQLLQTDSAGTGVEFTSNVDIPGTLDVTGAVTLDSTASVAGLLSADGKISFTAGTAALPAIYSGSDTNTGIYSPGADQFGISTAGSARFYIAADGDIGIGTTSPSYPLDVSGNMRVGSSTGYAFIQYGSDSTGTDNWHLGSEGDGTFRFYNGVIGAGSEKMRLNSSGNVLLGTSSPLTTFFGSTVDKLVIAGVAAPQVIGCYANNQFGPRLDLVKSRSGTVNGQTIVQTNDGLGEIYFGGSDGTGAIPAARIAAEVDGTPGTNDMPGRLVLSTTADGASTPSERVRISSSGNVGIGTSTTNAKLDIIGDANDSILPNNAIFKFKTGGGNGLYMGTRSSSPYQSYIQSAFQNNNNNSNPYSLLLNPEGGNIGIGTSSPGYPLDVSGNIRVGSSTGYAFIQYGSDSTNTDNWHVGSEGDGTFRFYNGVIGAGSELLRLNSDGDVLINQTATATPGLNNTNVGASFESIGGSGSALFVSRSNGTTLFLNVNGNYDVAQFRRSGTQVGSISVTTSATSYNTSSDYRLKENVVDLDGAINRVKQLAPKRFNFIVDADTTVDGFLAHEAQTVVPEAVTGTHNEVDDDGNAVMQGIDQSKLVPLLTAALKEAIAKIETLETKVAALEAAN